MISKGILLLQHTKEGKNILLVEKPYTYGFVDFLRSGKKMLNEKFVYTLLTDMTNKEKKDLLTLPFSKLWFRVNSKPFKFEDEETFLLTKSQQWFIKAINSLSKKSLWEIPKGKGKKGETDLETALREFEEETSITKDKIKLTGQVINYTIKDRGLFPVMYFVANTYEDIEIDNEKIDKYEVSNVKWVPLNEIYKYNGSEVINALIKEVDGLKK